MNRDAHAETPPAVEKEASGHCHFAGEHGSTDFQGFMEGAAVEGARAAEEIISGQ